MYNLLFPSYHRSSEKNGKEKKSDSLPIKRRKTISTTYASISATLKYYKDKTELQYQQHIGQCYRYNSEVYMCGVWCISGQAIYGMYRSLCKAKTGIG